MYRNRVEKGSVQDKKAANVVDAMCKESSTKDPRWQRPEKGSAGGYQKVLMKPSLRLLQKCRLQCSTMQLASSQSGGVATSQKAGSVSLGEGRETKRGSLAVV